MQVLPKRLQLAREGGKKVAPASIVERAPRPELSGRAVVDVQSAGEKKLWGKWLGWMASEQRIGQWVEVAGRRTCVDWHIYQIR